MPLKALANMGDDALVEALVDICTGLNVSVPCFPEKLSLANRSVRG